MLKEKKSIILLLQNIFCVVQFPEYRQNQNNEKHSLEHFSFVKFIIESGPVSESEKYLLGHQHSLNLGSTVRVPET
jgi:hypothetical protein